MPPHLTTGRGLLDWQVRSLKAIGSPSYPFDEAAAAETAGCAWDRDHDPLGMLRQAVAVLKSGDRTEYLRSLRVPTLDLRGESFPPVPQAGEAGEAQEAGGEFLLMGYFCRAGLDSFSYW